MKDDNYNIKRRPIRKKRAQWPKYMLLSMLVIGIGIGIACFMGLFSKDKPLEASSQQTVSAQSAGATPQTEKNIPPPPPKAAPVDDTALFNGHQYRIHIHKASHTLELFEKGKAGAIRTYAVGVGKNPAEKKGEGDNTTPTRWGNVEPSLVKATPTTSSADIPFVIDEILDASSWSHDFHDGKGVIEHAYGPWFISLNTGWNGIGIHGTHDPASIGHNVSEGCIRLHNNQVDELKQIVSRDNGGVGINVIISDD